MPSRPRRSRRTKRRSSRARRLRGGVGVVLLAVVLAAVAPSPVGAEDEAESPTASPTARVCACAPRVYRWTLDFASSCPPANVQECPTCGVNNLRCDIVSLDGGVTDLIPVVVNSYSVFELTDNLEVIKQTTRNGLDLSDGDSFDYTSIVETSAEDRPGALQLVMEGVNAAGEELSNRWIVIFSRLCDVLPFEEGDGMGWSIFTDLADPNPELCDAVTFSPTTRPTIEPTREPTSVPSPEPTTRSPVVSPTSILPTQSPTVPPVSDPTKEPTRSPVVMSMSMDFGDSPRILMDWSEGEFGRLPTNSGRGSGRRRRPDQKSRRRPALNGSVNREPDTVKSPPLEREDGFGGAFDAIDSLDTIEMKDLDDAANLRARRKERGWAERK